MKILVIGRGFDTPRSHEVGIFELDQAKALAAAGHDVRFAAVDVRSARRLRPWGYREYMLDGIPVHYAALPAGPISYDILRNAQDAAAAMIWKRLVRIGWRPDIVHGHFGIAGLALARKEGIPTVFTEHSSHSNKPDVTGGELRRERDTYALADALLCVSRSLAKNLRRHTGAEAAVVPNVLNAGVFSLPPVPHEGFRFVSAHNLVPGKNTAALLHAMTALPEHASLSIFGGGEERARLEALCRELHLQNRVRFLGNRPREELAAAYAAADCFVLASRSETFGLAYAEAMAAGLPVIATRCGGPEDFVNETNGLFVPVDDTAALTAAMCDMMHRRAKYDGAAIAEAVRRRFAPETVAAQLEEIYTALLSQTPGEKRHA